MKEACGLILYYRKSDWARHKSQCKRISKVIFEPKWEEERLRHQRENIVDDLASKAQSMREGGFLDKRGGWTEEEKKQRAAQNKT